MLKHFHESMKLVTNYLESNWKSKTLKIIQNLVQHAPKHLGQNWKLTLPLLWDTSDPSSFTEIYTTFTLEQGPR